MDFLINYFTRRFTVFFNKIRNDVQNESRTEEQILYFRLPFISNKINIMTERIIKQITRKYFNNVTIRNVFYNNLKTNSLVKHKESLDNPLCSMIVYKFVCPKCNSEYIGSTTKMLTTRFFEHKGVSSRTLNPLVRPPQSTIRDHCEDVCGVTLDISQFKIICKARFETELRLNETFYIEKLKPVLNLDNSCFNKKVF